MKANPKNCPMTVSIYNAMGHKRSSASITTIHEGCEVVAQNIGNLVYIRSVKHGLVFSANTTGNAPGKWQTAFDPNGTHERNYRI